MHLIFQVSKFIHPNSIFMYLKVYMHQIIVFFMPKHFNSNGIYDFSFGWKFMSATVRSKHDIKSNVSVCERKRHRLDIIWFEKKTFFTSDSPQAQSNNNKINEEKMQCTHLLCVPWNTNCRAWNTKPSEPNVNFLELEPSAWIEL